MHFYFLMFSYNLIEAIQVKKNLLLDHADFSVPYDKQGQQKMCLYLSQRLDILCLSNQLTIMFYHNLFWCLAFNVYV